MNRRTPPTLAEREARARAVTAERIAAERAADRTARVADVRARLALADAARPFPPVVGVGVYTRPPTLPGLEALARCERAMPGIIAAADHLAAEMHADALAAVPETHTAYDWETP